jgi:hypothetical protein
VTAPLWVIDDAAAFWEEAGAPEPFPRTLRGPILRSGLDLTVKELANLTVRAVQRHLAGLVGGWPPVAADRPLRACLFAGAGAGYIFLDAGDPAEEQVFSLAHELAHFLRDYWLPRRRAVAALGQAVLEVLDARRAPRPEERLHALLRGVPVGCHVHLMARGPGELPPPIAAAERDADRLAWELLAPGPDVLAQLPPRAGAARAAVVLTEQFGLPPAVAAAYAETLFPPCPAPDPLTARLKKAWMARRTSAGPGEIDSGGPGGER